MRLNLYLRGIDLIDVELHAGSKGLYVDLNWFKPREGEEAPADEVRATTADLTGTPSGSYERAEPFGVPDTGVVLGPELPDDNGFGFRRAT